MRTDEPDRVLDDEPDPRWIALADRIATGEQIDWDALARELDDPSGREVLRNLRTLASIGLLHSSADLPVGDWDEPASTDEDQWGPLRRIEVLGRGSFGTVWRAHDPRLQRDVALKLLHEDRALDAHERARFLEEGRALARLDHPQVVRVLGAEEHQGRLGLWMEFVRGRTLADIVRHDGRFAAEEAALIGEKIARALASVHQAGVVHRDVKAQNVMRAEGGRVVLMDFGASTALDPDGAASTVTGTPFYLAPELFEARPADVRSDLYALGVLLFFLVTGDHPLSAAHVAELRQMHREGRRKRLVDLRPDLPARFVEIVERALAADPRDRFASAGEFAQALATCAAPGAAAAVAPTIAPDPAPAPAASTTPARPRPSRRNLALGLTVLAAAAAIVTGIRLFGGAPFEVEASLLRFGEASVEELYSGARLTVGDELGLRVRTNQPSWVYVFNRDEAGRFHVMFPGADFPVQNPLASGAVHELPGRDAIGPLAWSVDTSGGEEQVLVVVARTRLEDLEGKIAALGAGEALSARTLEGLRGIGGVVRRASPEGAPARGDLFAAVDELEQGRSRSEDGVWIRRIVLRNP